MVLHPYEGRQNTIFQTFSLLFGWQGGRASSGLDHGLETLSGEAALAADMIMAFPSRMTGESEHLLVSEIASASCLLASSLPG